MFCPNCGYNNENTSHYCQRCGKSLTNNNIRQYNSSQYNQTQPPKNNRNVLIIAITIIIIALIIAGTFLLSSNNDDSTPVVNSGQQNSVIEDTLKNDTVVENTNAKYGGISIDSVTIYSDGNPNTGEVATINFGKKYAGERMEVMTIYSRDDEILSDNPKYEVYYVDENGKIVITDSTPMPKYPDNCLIEIKYGGNAFQFSCDVETSKGSHTTEPVAMEI